jgi:hypothetical protein
MSNVKEAIEEMIEESYLLSLSAEEIERDFTRFLDTCYAVLHAHVKDRAAVSGMVEDLAREKTCLLIADRARGPEAAAASGPEDDGGIRVPHQAFAGRVARRKRMILKTIGEYDPQLVRLIDEQRFRANAREPRRPRLRLRRRRDWERLGLILMRLGYAATVVLIIGLVYLGLARR